MALNLEKQLVFYGAYHHNAVNVGIHITCVPILLATGITLATNTPDVALPSYLTIPNLPLNLGTAGAIGYSLLYILMEPIAGGMYAPFIMASAALGNYLTHTYGSIVTYWAAGIHAVCWVAQFVGHGKYEGRAPALLDNLVQALFLAPFFVWFEVLFYFGYRPELKSRLNKSIEAEIAKFKDSKEKKANGVKKP